MTGDNMTQKSKSILINSAFHFVSGLIITAIGATLIYILPETKQSPISAWGYTGTIGSTAVLIGVFMMALPLIRALVSKAKDIIGALLRKPI